LLGAHADEVVIADSTSVNLFKLAVAALRHQHGRTRILTDDLNFPSDLYVLQGAVEMLGGGRRLEIVPSPDSVHGPVDALLAQLDDDVALVVLSHTVFKSGYLYDMAAITAAAHAAGALVLWDLSHSAGSVPVTLNDANADLAIGCTYKYVNGGPGAPAFLYVRRDLQALLHNPISGWMGQHDPFAFGLEYVAAPGVRHFLTGTPPVLSLALIEPGVDLLAEAGMAALRAKSVQQTEYFIALWERCWRRWATRSSRRARRSSAGRTSRSVTSRAGASTRRSSAISMYCPIFVRRTTSAWALRRSTRASLTSIRQLERLRRAVDERIYARYSSQRAAVT
jgi:kynureninase